MKPILKYPGAKWALASWIVRYLPQTPNYVEPFCGSAAVYFNLPWRPRHAILNDLSGDIVNLFRVIRERGDELAALVEMTPWAREEYERSYEVAEEPVERARRFLVRTWQGHGSDGMLGGKTWAGQEQRNGRGKSFSRTMKWRRVPDSVLIAADRLLNTHIEQMPAVDLLAGNQDTDTLVYADPPYVFSTRTRGNYYYAHEMTNADHVALLDALDAHPGPVALSGYRCDLYDDRLGHWRRVETQAQAEKGNTRTECLWLNPVCQERLGYGPLFTWKEDAA